jgi:hypothetical protein
MSSRIPAISGISMDTAKVRFGNLAYTNYYELFIKPSWGGGGSTGKAPFLEFIETNKDIYKVDVDFITRELGILCSEAVLPASSYATSEVKDNFMGVTQEFAHTRLFTDIDLTFYIDRDYRVLNFFEAWMNYISGGGEVPLNSTPGYYRRFNYPNNYKNKDGIFIKKFERDFATDKQRSVTYQLVNAFPKNMASIPVAYGGADLLKVSVSFNYDYYIVNREQAADSTSTSTDNSLVTPQSLKKAIELGFPIPQSVPKNNN